MNRDRSSLLRTIKTQFAWAIRSIVGRCYRDNSLDAAAQVSFYFALSVFPFLLVLAALVGWTITTARWEIFAEWLTTYMPRRTQHVMLAFMLELTKSYGKFLSAGLLLTLWSASTGFLSLMDALTRAYGMRDERSYVKRRFIAMCATILSAGFLILCFGIWNVGHMLAGMLASDFGNAVVFQYQWPIARGIATLIMLWLGVEMINYFLPGRHNRWRWITPGSVFSVLSLFGTSAVLNLFLSHSSRISRIYGTLTGFVVLMLWIYIANLSLLVGAETDTVVTELETYGAGG
jgi:membrane protein